MKKVYELVIVYDTESEEIKFIDETTTADKPSFTIGNVDITEYYDEDILKLIDECYVLGES